MKNSLHKNEITACLTVLKTRFEKHMHRHKGMSWDEVQNKLEANQKAIYALHQMEVTGGEPDVVAYDKKLNTYTFMDCSAETPTGRRSLCYDDEALEQRKENKPKGSAMGLANAMGINLLNEDQYKYLQTLGSFDVKTSTWLHTPAEVRKLGGALFGDYRFGRVFVYHNGVQSYYAARGFRGVLMV